MSKVKVEVKKGRGRPSQVKREIFKNSIQFAAKTDKEMVIFLLEKTPIRSFMKPGTEEILRRNLYVSVRKAREESLAKGKKVAFKGRLKDGKIVKKWLHQTKKAKVVENQISSAQVGV